MQRIFKLIFFCFTLSPFLTSAQSTGKVFVDEAPKLVFGSVQGQFLEGPPMSPDGLVYFSDIILRPNPMGITGLIWQYNPKTGKTEVYRSPSGSSNGLAFDKQGRLVVCEASNQGGQRITRTDMRTGISRVLTGRFNGKRYNDPNDLVMDKVGNIYFTDNRIAGDEPTPQPVHGVYKIDTAGTVSLVIAYIQKPNGIALSPDQKTLYISTSDNQHDGDVTRDYKGDPEKYSGKILGYSILEDGRVTFEKELVDYQDRVVDGMAVDTEGNLYAAIFFQAKLVVLSPEGEILDELQFPKFVTNAAFGRGEYSSTLFVTGLEGLYEVQTNKQGFHHPFEELPTIPTFQSIELKAKKLDVFVGVYQVNENYSIKVFREGGKLFAQGTQGSKMEMFAYEEGKFFFKVIDAQLIFQTDSRGKATGFDLLQNGQAFTFKRIE